MPRAFPLSDRRATVVCRPRRPRPPPPPGNTLVVWKLDRLGRDLKHLVTTVEELRTREVGLKVLSGAGAQIDTMTPWAAVLWDFRGARRIRAGIDCRTDPRRTGCRQGARAQGRAAAQDEPGGTDDGHDSHGGPESQCRGHRQTTGHHDNDALRLPQWRWITKGCRASYSWRVLTHGIPICLFCSIAPQTPLSKNEGDTWRMPIGKANQPKPRASPVKKRLA